jgi:hypothetical protein
MSLMTKDDIYTFQPRRIALGAEPPGSRRFRRSAIEHFLKTLSGIVARRRRAHLRSQLELAHRWERARRREHIVK